MKKTITQRVGELCIDEYFETYGEKVPLDVFIRGLSDFADDVGGEVFVGHAYTYSSCELVLFSERTETDEEYEARMNAEERENKAKQKKEMKRLLGLDNLSDEDKEKLIKYIQES